MVKERQYKWQYLVKLLNFKVILAVFGPNYLEAVAMATGRQMSELLLFFFDFTKKESLSAIFDKI